MGHFQTHSAGYNSDELKAAIRQQVLAGAITSPQLLFDVPSPVKELSRLKRVLESDSKWQSVGKMRWNEYGCAVQAIASWGKGIAVEMRGHTYRFKILHLDHFDRRIVFSIPAQQIDSGFKLPGIDFSGNELRALIEMANDISFPPETVEYSLRIKHPARDTLMWQRDRWSLKELDEPRLVDLLEREPAVLHIGVAALDAQLRVFKEFKEVPCGIFNFQVLKRASSAEAWFLSVVRAMTFTNDPGCFSDGPIEIAVKDTADLNRWETCVERLTILRASSTTLLWLLVEKVEESEQRKKSGGYAQQLAPTLFPTTPIILGRSVLQSSLVADIELPAAPTPLSPYEQDMLRTAISALLSRDVARMVYRRWKQLIVEPAIYRVNRFQLWQDILTNLMVKTWFSDARVLERARSLQRNKKTEEEHAKVRREELLGSAFVFVSDPDRYLSQIVERPNCIAEAEDLLAGDAVAFWYSPMRGGDKGKTFLAFTSDSLKRLLRQVGCGEELYESFLRRCERGGILDQKNRSITLGEKTFNAVTLKIKK